MELKMETMVAVRFYAFEGSAYCPPSEFQFLGFYIPEEDDLKRFDGDIAIYLDEDEIEFLTTLGMVTDSNFPALMSQVENAVEEWWKDNMDTIESYYGLDGDAF